MVEAVKSRSFKGGFRFPRFESTPDPGAEHSLALPEKVVIPVIQGYGAALNPTVKVGDRVKVGQVIARNDDEISTPIHATVSGTVKEIDRFTHPLRKPTLSIVIESDGEDTWAEPSWKTGDPAGLSPDEIRRILYEAGVTAGGDGGFPTEFKSSTVGPDRVSHLVINLVETDPYLKANQQLVLGNQARFVTGLRIMTKALGDGVTVHLALDSREKSLADWITKELSDIDNLKVYMLTPKYPQGEAAVLCLTLLDIVIPAAKTPPDVGVVVQSVPQVLSAYDAVVEGKPLVERVISVGGNAAKSPGNLRVRLGTPIKDIINSQANGEQDLDIAVNGLIKGVPLADTNSPVTRDISGITILAVRKRGQLLPFVRPGSNLASYTRAFFPLPTPKSVEPKLHGDERPCLNCGSCLEVCPMGLNPAWLARYVEYKQLEKAEKLDILACIDCNLCSWVCPSKIPLATQIKNGKKRLLKRLAKKSKPSSEAES